MTRWLLGNLGAGYWDGLVIMGLIRQDNTQALLQSFGGAFAGLTIKAVGLHGNLTRLVDNNGDVLHGLGLHHDIQTNRAISHHGLTVLATLLPSFQLGFFNSIHLLELVKHFWDAPESSEVVV